MATTQDKEIVLTEVGTKPKKKKRRRRRQRNPIPTSMRNNSELNHPALTKGQKKFLGSICTVYSTENMKQNIEEQYVRQLMYEKDKGIIKNADWVKYLDYFCQSSKRKHLFKQPNRNVTRAKTVKVRSRFYGNGPILAPLPPIPRSPSGSPRERTTEDSKPVSNTNYVTTIRRDEDKQEDVLENDPVDAQVTVIGDDDDVVAAGVEKVDKASADEEEEELSNVDLENTVEPAESDETQEESDEAVESAKKTKRVTIAEDKPDDDSSDEEKEASSAKVSADEEKTKEDDDDSGAFGKAWAKSDISPSTNEETPPETDEESTTTELPPPEESSTEAVASAVEADEVSSKADELSTTEELPSTTDEQTTETTEEPPEEQTTQTTEEPPEEQTTETTEEPPEEQPSTTEEPSTHTTEEPSSVVVETTTSEDKTPPPPPLGVPTIDLFTLLDQPTLEESVEPERSKSRIE